MSRQSTMWCRGHATHDTINVEGLCYRERHASRKQRLFWLPQLSEVFRQQHSAPSREEPCNGADIDSPRQCDPPGEHQVYGGRHLAECHVLCELPLPHWDGSRLTHRAASCLGAYLCRVVSKERATGCYPSHRSPIHNHESSLFLILLILHCLLSLRLTSDYSH
jgi:hypothetical protein